MSSAIAKFRRVLFMASPVESAMEQHYALRIRKQVYSFLNSTRLSLDTR